MGELSNKQMKAIPYLVNGLTDQEVAEQVGVTRETINTWKNKNYEFKAELNKYRNSVMETIRDKQKELMVKAYDVIEKHLNEQLEAEEMEVKAALEIIKTIKLSNAELETDADVLRDKEIARNAFSRLM